MAINLLNIQPTKVSRDLSGYITYIYGPGGAGKTSLAVQAPGALLLAFERGYNALPGVMAQDITTWGQVKEVLRELKKPDVKALFRTVIVDTADIAAQLCEKYICSQLNIENIGDGGWATNGWAKVKREWEQTFRAITMEGYALIFISHSKEKAFKPKNAPEYTQIVPSCSTAYNEIIRNMSDLQAYISVENNQRFLVFRSPNGDVECKSRFKYIAPTVELSYKALVKALNDAIDQEAAETNNQYVTSEHITPVATVSYDYDALMAEFSAIAGELMNKDQTKYGPLITQVIDKYLGRGRRIAETTPDQAEFVYLILQEVKEIKEL